MFTLAMQPQGPSVETEAPELPFAGEGSSLPHLRGIRGWLEKPGPVGSNNSAFLPSPTYPAVMRSPTSSQWEQSRAHRILLATSIRKAENPHPIFPCRDCMVEMRYRIWQHTKCKCFNKPGGCQREWKGTRQGRIELTGMLELLRQRS